MILSEYECSFLSLETVVWQNNRNLLTFLELATVDRGLDRRMEIGGQSYWH